VDIDQNTFCAAPWFQIRNDNQGEYRPCCQIRPQQSEFQGKKNFVFPLDDMEEWINSNYVQYLRQSLAAGNKIAECNECWQKESSGQLSLRKTINNTVTGNRGDRLNKSWINAYFKNKKDYLSNLICSIDIKLTNLCNYSCVMCNPQDSTQIMSKWIMQKDHPGLQNRLQENTNWQNDSQNLVNSKHRYNLLSQAINHRPQHLKILGGEPLIDEEMFKILSSIPTEQKQNINLLFVTNGSVSLSHVQNKLSDWKNIYFVVSLDGIGAVQDYIRHGSRWQEIKNNIIHYLSHQPGNRLWVNYTVQSLTLYHLPELLEFCYHYQIELSTGMLNEPDFFTLSAIPDDLKYKIVDKLSLAEELPGSWGDRAKGNRKLLQGSNHDPALLKKMWEYLSWYDPVDKWKNIFPEWIPYQVR
jgi:hypothetical protein